LFVVSFHHRADPVEQRAMLVTSLRFGLPALLPLAFGSSTHVDYFAHAGRAIAGGAVGLAVCAQWSPANFRPDFARQAALMASVGLALSIVSCGIAATRYPTYAPNAAQFKPVHPVLQSARNCNTGRSTAAGYPRQRYLNLFRR
jgi:hypothetical protein